MPDDRGKLSDDELKQVNAWLDAHWTNQICPASGHNQWSLQESLGQVPQYEGAPNFVFGGPRTVYPALVVICNTCGYQMLFNAMVMGILNRSEVPDA